MNKVTVTAVALMVLLGFGTLSFAQGAKDASATAAQQHKAELIRGTIESIDTAGNTIVIKDSKTQETKTIAVDAKRLASLKTGQNVKVMVTAGTNKAEKVTVIKKHKATK